ncbi:Crp/Fnr family transcriptional regulator [Capillimicrobium parvum]|uniref:HTH crp-type domain-containing protein n=1 Tax=Capillimicrobium parvum TaxID=2884022 RepID=A0A9E7C0N4_9ACTN|nr:Crp/Fnr family transcriptional regulator [Capillimicrobium parvum]UGS36615.1 hypothetical protein DSM104329_03023 [Capillimicrobium parvum]
MAAIGAIRLFEADPDLLDAVPEPERGLALRATAVPAVRAALGAWDTSSVGEPEWGILIVDGVFVREVGFAGSTSAELLGPGDVVLVGGNGPTTIAMPTADAWTVIDPGRVAVLDAHLQAAVRRWPRLSCCLLQRSERRASRLALAQSISHLTRVDARVLMMLWLLADRWGRVAREALVIPLPLTHRTLARLVGARRPSVTTAITQLTQRGLVSRRDDGAWVVHGAPPAELDRVGIEPLPARPWAAPQDETEAARSATNPAPTERLTAIVEVRRRLAADVPRLAAAYEAQRDRTREIAERSREARENARRLRDARLTDQ